MFTRFTPVEPFCTPDAVENLCHAYEQAVSAERIDALILIPSFIIDFLCIHPFSDGNGRVSRLLMLLLYYKAGFDVGKFISMESMIMESRDYYYEALRESSEGWETNQNTYVPFIKYCMYILSECYRKLNKLFLSEGGKKKSKAGRIEALVSNSMVPVSKQEICNQLSDVSTATVQIALNRLLKEGKIQKIGTYRNARYSKA